MKSPTCSGARAACGASRAYHATAPCRRSNATTGNPCEAEQYLTVAYYPQHIHSLKSENVFGSPATCYARIHKRSSVLRPRKNPPV